MNATPVPLQDLLARIEDGAELALPPDNSLTPIAAAIALARRGVRDLRLIGVPIAGLAADLLIGAGSVRAIETSAVSLGEAGLAPCFTRAVAERRIAVTDSTCPAVHTSLQAAEKGVPFLPLRGVLGSDLVAHRPDWRVIDNPFAQDGADPILLLPALSPDIALIHAVLADEAGNLWIGRRRELATLAHAARRTLATVEALVPGNLLEDETMAPGVLPAIYVEAFALVPGGARPLGCLDRYAPDAHALEAYARAARDPASFRTWLEAQP